MIIGGVTVHPGCAIFSLSSSHLNVARSGRKYIGIFLFSKYWIYILGTKH